MKIMAVVAMAVAVGMSARAEQTVLVYLQDVAAVPSPVLRRAQDIAAEMFAGAGVRIEWREGRPNPSQLLGQRAIVARMSIDTATAFMPGTFAFARVYEGVHITVFWNRVQRKTTSATAVVVLAHVLVHEITHILQGIDRHSESGIMKAHWTGQDYSEMSWKPLPFTPDDVDFIQRSLARREGGGTLTAAKSVQQSPR